MVNYFISLLKSGLILIPASNQIIKISKPEILQIALRALLSAWVALFSATESATFIMSKAPGKKAFKS